MAPAAGLLSCSNEVLTIIISNPSLSKQDLKSLRLTSKEICPAATREFAKRYVTEPFFVISRRSLQSLVDICRHPIFSPYIRTIGFLATTLHTEGLKERVLSLDHGAARDQMDKRLSFITGISEYASLFQEQVQLETSGEIERLMANALEALDHSISITVSNDLESISSKDIVDISSMIHRQDDYGRRYSRACDVEPKMRSLFGSIEKIVAGLSSRNRLPLTGLTIHLRRLTHTTGGPDCLAMVRPHETYSNLTTFHLDMDLEALRCTVSFESVKELFKAASKLQELSLTTSCKGTRAVGISTLDRVTKLFSFETTFELRVLVLTDVPCTLECLKLIMERYKKTLMDVRLSRVTLLGSWKDCLSWMHTKLDLESLHISHPLTISRSRTTRRGTFVSASLAWQAPPTVSLRGKEVARTGLSNLIRQTPHS
ncbi:hypothetical protein KCU92_g7728, partial [Aureobasidium melanogenum]|jgi:hypothetical protein